MHVPLFQRFCPPVPEAAPLHFLTTRPTFLIAGRGCPTVNGLRCSSPRVGHDRPCSPLIFAGTRGDSELQLEFAEEAQMLQNRMHSGPALDR